MKRRCCDDVAKMWSEDVGDDVAMMCCDDVLLLWGDDVLLWVSSDDLATLFRRCYDGSVG